MRERPPYAVRRRESAFALWDSAVFGKGMASAMPHPRETSRTPRKGGRNPTLSGLPSLLCFMALARALALPLGVCFDFAGASIGSHTLGSSSRRGAHSQAVFLYRFETWVPRPCALFARAGGTNLYDGCLLRYKSATLLTLEPNDVEASDARPSQRARRTGHPLL
jgi:hypothetical protein